MASGSGSGINSDPAWKYCSRLEGNKNGTKCSFCNLVIQSGGITRFKFHLTHTDPAKNARKCPKVPPEVKAEILKWMQEKNTAKKKKAMVIENIRSELRGGLSGNQNQSDDDEEDDDDVYMYPADMNIEEREAYRAAVWASKQSEWQRQEEAAIFRHKGKMGSTSRSSGSNEVATQLRRTQSVKPSYPDPPLAPSLYKSAGAKQKSLKNMLKGGSLKEKLGRLVTKFFIYESVPPNKVQSHHWQNLLTGAAEIGPGVPGPTAYEIKNKYLDMEYKDIKEYVDSQKEKWEMYGCTIMCDGWTGPTKLSIINFMVYSKGSTVFLKSVDASNKIKDHAYIYDLLKEVMKEVGKRNVVQIVTDNGSAFVKAGKKMMNKYSLFWTPCAAHCIDLIFEDIGKNDMVAQVISQAKLLSNFIYSHGMLLAQMREVCNGDLVRPGATRFATNYIALNSILKKSVILSSYLPATGGLETN